MTYQEFLALIKSYTIRDDAPIISFILRAESHLRPIVRHYLAEKTIVLSITDDIADLPADFIEIRAITGTEKRYKPISINSATSDEVGYYRIGSTLIFAGKVEATVKLTYYSAFTPLTETNQNWLFGNFQNVYISAVLREFYRWEKDAEGVASEQGALNEALSVLAEDDRRGRMTGSITIGGPTWH
ncbi:phage adaptor protein [Agrobacterium rosae]|uniref:Uncharacterized protein n=1 Tax=Agrobacterium rosae TaxID=1972867 RepID=A0AAE5RTL4_9HYPH|nr:hypothetical protein [Agrobacterium rosae]KAA3511611.1 hypothetical protein DXM21_14290 [Agrobacterium rosae]KAA3518965.1 hypothetical protein DXM25_13725 [Agrobacterium rosae]MQB49307.1 hypothetical protein [Agrobacterium rosae]POO49149.1 hypothetical protein CPJ18_22115 [Agrobacterium rosae]